LPRFYGITLTGWTDQPRTPDDNTVLLEEGATALADVEDDGLFHEDLGRAWYLLTQTPYVSHICVVPRRLVSSDRVAVEQAVARLDVARSLATERARELRRDLTRAYGVDRELLTEVLAEQTNELGSAELGGLKSLYSFSGRTSAANRLESAIFSL
jgi:predicted solute-binding protein